MNVIDHINLDLTLYIPDCDHPLGSLGKLRYIYIYLKKPGVLFIKKIEVLLIYFFGN